MLETSNFPLFLLIYLTLQTIKKWRDLKSKTKNREAERRKELRKTGGGESSAADTSTIDLKVLNIIGSVCVSGIPQGVDSGSTGVAITDDIEGTRVVAIQDAMFYYSMGIEFAYRVNSNTIHRGTYMSAHVLLNLVNELGKRYTM